MKMTLSLQWFALLSGLFLASTAAAQSEAEVLVAHGHAEQGQGNFAEAIGYFNRALKLEPKSVSIYCDRAAATQEKGDLEAAIADYDQAVSLDPNRAETYSERAVAKGAKNDVDGAIADHTRAIELDPTLAQSYSDRGLDKLSKGDLQGAAADCEKGVALGAGGVPEAYRDRGIVNQAAGRWREALADHRRYCELAADRGDYAQFYIWIIRSRLGETKLADLELTLHLDDIPKTEEDAWTRNVATFLLGKLAEADFFALAISQDEKKDRGQHCEAYYYAGIKKLLAGDKAEAVEDFRKCLATEKRTFTEYEFAKAELKALTK